MKERMAMTKLVFSLHQMDTPIGNLLIVTDADRRLRSMEWDDHRWRSPHRSVCVRLRIRLLPRMDGGRSAYRDKDAQHGLRNPPVEQWVDTVHPGALAAEN